MTVEKGSVITFETMGVAEETRAAVLNTWTVRNND
jgi:hypothetical protein